MEEIENLQGSDLEVVFAFRFPFPFPSPYASLIIKHFSKREKNRQNSSSLEKVDRVLYFFPSLPPLPHPPITISRTGFSRGNNFKN